MTTEKRKRGRPQGTGKDDTPVLREIATMIVAEPGLKVATALKRVCAKPSEALIRRIQIKFREHRSEWLAEARARCSSIDRPARTSTSASLSALDSYLRAKRQMDEALGIGGAYQRAIAEVTDSPVMRAQRELRSKIDSIMLALDTPTDRLVRQMRNDPYERMMRSVYGWKAHLGPR